MSKVEGLDPKPENRVFAAKFGNVPVMLRASPWLALLRAWGCAQLGPADCRGGVAFPVRQGAVDGADEQRSRHRRAERGRCLPLRGTEGLSPEIFKMKQQRRPAQRAASAPPSFGPSIPHSPIMHAVMPSSASGCLPCRPPLPPACCPFACKSLKRSFCVAGNEMNTTHGQQNHLPRQGSRCSVPRRGACPPPRPRARGAPVQCR